MICISIPEKNIGKCIAVAGESDMAEIRIDMAGFDEQEVRMIFSKAKKPLIATCRPEFVEDALRVKLLKSAMDAGAAYVDIESDADEKVQQDLIQYARSHNCRVIISYHNFENTPDTKELHSVIDACFDSGADIVKIATTANTPADSARILGLYGKYSSLVALAMGEAGKITRVANLYSGSPFTYASISDELKTAAGQLSVFEIEFIKTIIDKV
jgi:3-dehydroquinate dehydratase I